MNEGYHLNKMLKNSRAVQCPHIPYNYHYDFYENHMALEDFAHFSA